MSRPLPRLDSIPGDHNVPVTTWTLFNGHDSDSVVEERSFIGGSSIVVRVQNIGVFVKVTVSDGVGETSELMPAGQVLMVQTSGLGEKIPYRIKVKAENQTNELTAIGAPLSVLVTVVTVQPTPPIPSFRRPPTAPIPAPVPPTQERFHIVKQNEFLRKIAGIYYNDPNKWKVIYDANIPIIGPNPNLIYTGQRLRIP